MAMATPSIEKTIEDLLKLMNIAFDAVEKIESPESKHTRFLVRTKESPILIGTNGEHFSAFNYIVRRIASKSSGEAEPAKFIVDVNDYHERSLDALKAKAKIMSDRAISFKVDIELEPMSSYERMIIHSSLQDIPDIKTESKGEGRERRVVIKYVESRE